MNARIAAEPTESRADQADARLKPELAALTAADLTRMNVDVAKTAQQVAARLPKLRARVLSSAHRGFSVAVRRRNNTWTSGPSAAPYW